MKKIIIIGGGIAGLAAAYRIQRKISEGADLGMYFAGRKRTVWW